MARSGSGEWHHGRWVLNRRHHLRVPSWCFVV